MFVACATDLGPESPGVFAHALALADRSGGRLLTVHASPEGQTPLLPDADTLLERWERPVGLVAYRQVVEGDVDAIVKVLAEEPLDLLVVGTHQRRGLLRAIHGSYSEKLASRAHLPTLNVPLGLERLVDTETGAVRLESVLIPAGDINAEQSALWALRELCDALWIDNLEVTLLSVDREIPAGIRKEGWTVRRLQLDGDITGTIAQAAEQLDVDLVVMATRGHADGVVDRLVGSHTEQVTRRVNRPVLSVPLRDGL